MNLTLGFGGQVLALKYRVVLDLFSNFKWVRSSGYFGEPLEQVITLRGPFWASRTGDEG